MKRKVSAGRFILLIGIFILCAGLALNAFEVIPITVFRLSVAAGIVVQLAALVFILKRKEF